MSPNQGQFCDGNIFGGISPCDPYVKVFVNGDNLFTTSTKDDSSYAIFMESHTSNKMFERARIRLKVWDYDTGVGAYDDLILECNHDIRRLSSSKINCANDDVRIEASYIWK